METAMVDRSVRKEVRLTPLEAKRLSRLAKDLGKSESEILRRGLKETEEDQRRLDMRRKNMHRLIRMAEEVPGPAKPNPIRLK